MSLRAYNPQAARLYGVDAGSIKRRIDPRAFYEHELNVDIPRSHGWTKAGICPFHDTEKRGSFAINLETGSFRCHSRKCGAHGSDVIAFTMQRYGLDFRSALRQLLRDWS